MHYPRHELFCDSRRQVRNEKRLDIISNNLANAQTAGFKASRPNFEMISSTEDETGQVGLLKNSYVKLSDTYIDFSDASIVESGAKLDMAILGPGFSP